MNKAGRMRKSRLTGKVLALTSTLNNGDLWINHRDRGSIEMRKGFGDWIVARMDSAPHACYRSPGTSPEPMIDTRGVKLEHHPIGPVRQRMNRRTRRSRNRDEGCRYPPRATDQR